MFRTQRSTSNAPSTPKPRFRASDDRDVAARIPLTLHAAEPLLPQFLPQSDRAAVRELFDRGLALLLMILASPLLLATAAAVKLSSRGPVLFEQPRAGLGGQPFQMFKFRSMVKGAASQEDSLQLAGVTGSGPFFKVRDDLRLTPVGGLLRRTSLDELPQLWNVVRGEMSLVGPRPLLIREYLSLHQDVKEWRFGVKPGITGLWQVSGRSRTTASSRLRLDRHYVKHAGLGTDLRILVRTPAAVLRTRDAF